MESRQREKPVGAIDGVAPYFVSKEYVFFVPHRRGQGQSPGPYIWKKPTGLNREVNAASFWLTYTKLNLEDQLAGLEYLKNLSIVDKNRVVVMGNSFGGIQTMLAVERGPGYRVAVDCFWRRRDMEQLFKFALTPHRSRAKSEDAGIFSAG